MFKSLGGSAPAYLAYYCTSTYLVPGRSALGSAAHGDIVVPSHRTDCMGFEIFCDSWPQQLECFDCWCEVFFFGLDPFAKHLKHIYLVQRAHDRAHIFEFILQFVGCDTVTVSPNQIIIIIIIINF